MAELITPQALALLAAVGVVITAVRKVWPWLRRAVYLVDDLYGTDARPGVPARPGVAERLTALESDVSDTKEAAQSAAYHSKANSGHSAYDILAAKVDEIAAKVDEIAHLFGGHVQDSKAWVRAVDGALDAHGIDTPPWPER